MKYAVQYRNRSRYFANAPFVLGPIIGIVFSYQGAVVGFIIGFILSALLCTHWPRWASGLNYDDIARAIRKLKETGLDGGSAILIKCNRHQTLRVIKDKFIRSDLGLGVMLPTSEWKELLDSGLRDKLGDACGAEPVSVRKSFKRHICFFPESQDADRCLDMVKVVAENTVGMSLEGVIARSILCRDFVWAQEQEVNGLKICASNFNGIDESGVISYTTPKGEPKKSKPGD